MLQALQHMTVAAEVDPPSAVYNYQNNNVTTEQNILCNCNMVEVI